MNLKENRKKKENGGARKYDMPYISFANATKTRTTNKIPHDIYIHTKNAYRDVAFRLAEHRGWSSGPLRR